MVAIHLPRDERKEYIKLNIINENYHQSAYDVGLISIYSRMENKPEHYLGDALGGPLRWGEVMNRGGRLDRIKNNDHLAEFRLSLMKEKYDQARTHLDQGDHSAAIYKVFKAAQVSTHITNQRSNAHDQLIATEEFTGLSISLTALTLSLIHI